MDIKVKISPLEINKAINSAIKSLAKSEAEKFINKHYVRDDESMRAIIHDAVVAQIQSPEFMEYLKEIASDVARIKAASFVRNNQNEFIK